MKPSHTMRGSGDRFRQPLVFLERPCLLRKPDDALLPERVSYVMERDAPGIKPMALMDRENIMDYIS